MEQYRTIEDLPRTLRNELPEDAQRMYLAVHQRVSETSAMGGKKGDERMARTAHEAAMLEVQRRFEKDGKGNWVQAPVGDDIDTDKLDGGVPDSDLPG